jgi:2-hydroxymuconate-semialdehyde hydrolase
MAETRTERMCREDLLRGLPLEHRRLMVDGVATSVLEAGAGPSMILLHGGIECGGAYWALVIGRLAQTHRLLVPDLPGLGESDPFPRLDARAFDNWLRSLMHLTAVDRPALVAHSLVASLAARFATGHPDLLDRLVVYAGPAIGAYRVPAGFRLAAIRFSVRPTERNAERFDRWALHDLDGFRGGHPDWYAAFNAYCRSRSLVPHVRQTMIKLLREGTKRIPDGQLDRISCPTALLWGRHDRMVPLSLAQDARTRQGWPLFVLDGAGHVPHMEQPEAFVRVLAEIESSSLTHHRETS